MVSAEEYGRLLKDFADLDAKYVQLLSDFKHVSDQLDARIRYMDGCDALHTEMRDALQRSMRAYAARSK